MVAEFQAVVFAAGKGSRFPEILEGRPKCLLPIGSYPLIWYPLKILQRHGFTDVIVIALEHEKSEIQQRLEKTQLRIKIDFCTISGESDIGTADALRLISDRIRTDVVLVSCDTIVEFSLYPVLKQFRELDASFVSLLVPNCAYNVSVPGPKTKYKLEQDLFGICASSNRLIFMGSASDFEQDLKLPGYLLRQNGKVDIRSGLQDAHIYVIKKWVLDFLEMSPNYSTLKGELLPFIVKKQMLTNSNTQVQSDKPVSEVNVKINAKDINQLTPYTAMDKKIFDSSIFNKEPPSMNEQIRCYVVVAPDNTFGIRVNTLAAFCSANRQIYKIFQSVTDLPETALIAPSSDIKSKQITSTAVSDQAVVMEKTSISSTTIGANCTINSKVKITNSILMDYVTIGENVTIENCIVCEKSNIKSGSTLRNCLVGSNYTVPNNTIKENQHLSNSDGFMEI
ncbi:translation initiation factor eIF-2B subunit gamma [Malaya genurostris]|uniref:translation initiation factor eIF-2B subunit gamma n=1 Tax=Malaya genurostris TaxID=325434 RepID=UPI0026F3F280|nr:translation initiation factor eIF-2B subunit gamma [Malaya genurostris]